MANIPSTEWVSQRPRDKGLLEAWFDSVASFIQSIQSMQKNDLLVGDSTVGSCRAIKLGPLCYVQGTLSLPADLVGTDLLVTGIPLAPDENVPVTVVSIGSVGTLEWQPAAWMTIGDKTLHLLPITATVTFNAWFLVPVQKH